ncbi:DUF2382 domain-containing protein [Ornithinimicrobium pekingense]|uniref:DUF2382 domain-containing protein n=1 Tax=Ornithinimicrobium pekingense TaxID=384677 RepID=A0ABQ2FGI0_9MICO|nr:PRC and DUF2382 domain-containing protein [Ornithinimicrobium pekingense]GGK83712.1 hypothetical protein GCM10011509_35230 [Ornithinimicrobium pekingense]
MSITTEHIEELYTAEVVDRDGSTLGSVGQVYLDDDTGQPAWVTVKTGFFGTSESFVPLDDAEYADGRVRVPYEKSYVKDAPNMESDAHLSEAEQDELYRYYKVGSSGATDGEPLGGRVDTAGVTGAGGDDRDRDRGDVERRGDDERMTLLEEQVRVGTEKVQTGRVRLRKHVVTEQETVTVPVQREEYEIVREPVHGDTPTTDDLGEDEVEVAVHEERPVVGKDVVATEEVGIDRRTVTAERDVTTNVAREEVDVVEDDTTTRPDTTRR